MLLGPHDALLFNDLPGRASADPFAGLAGAEGLEVSVRVVRMTHATGRRPHRHPFSCEVVHVLSGSGEAWQDGTRHAVAAGDTFVVPEGVAHATLPAPGGHLELLCVFPHPDLATNLEELDGPELA